MGETDETDRVYDPRFGIYPERYHVDIYDDDQNLDTFCAVCGVPIRVIAEVLQIEKNKYKWLLDAVRIRQSSLEQRGTNRETERFHGYGEPLEVIPIPNDFVFYQWRGWGEGAPLIHERYEPFPWVGIHRKCFYLMKRLIEYRTNALHLVPDDSILRVFHKTSTRVPMSLGEMYEVYQFRIYRMPDVTWHHLQTCAWKVLEPHRYYYNETPHDARHPELYEQPELFKQLEWPFGSPDVVKYEAPPFPIDDLLPRILSYLQPLPTGSTVTTPTLQSKLDRLPIEIQEQIYQNLHPFTHPPAECTRHLAPSVWKNLLFQGQILPWLWDLDQSDSTMTDENTLTMSIQHLCINKQHVQASTNQSLCTDSAEDLWDWELLVRQLAQYDAFEPGGIMEDMPYALQNRRRIWRLLDEARQGDVRTEDFRGPYDPCNWRYSDI